MNWIIKQWFYLRWFLGIKRKIFGEPLTFASYDLGDGRWIKKWNYWWVTDESFRQRYGLFRFTARLDGKFEEDAWPALWMVESGDDYYVEIDIELMKSTEHPYLLYTTWVNDTDQKCPGDDCKVKRVKLSNRSLINKLQHEFHDFYIDWNRKRVKFYIDGLLSGIIRNVPHREMYIVVGKATVERVLAYDHKDICIYY